MLQVVLPEASFGEKASLQTFTELTLLVSEYRFSVYIVDVKPKFAKLFMNGNSQAVRLPQEFRFKGEKVRVQRVGNGVLLEPDKIDLDVWFKQLHSDASDFEIVRDQPITPEIKMNFE